MRPRAKAAADGVAVVAKDTNVLWSREDLTEARDEGRYAAESRVAPPHEREVAVSRIFPGCLQQDGAAEDYSDYVLRGQTEHFLLFAKGEAPWHRGTIRPCSTRW